MSEVFHRDQIQKYDILAKSNELAPVVIRNQGSLVTTVALLSQNGKMTAGGR